MSIIINKDGTNRKIDIPILKASGRFFNSRFIYYSGGGGVKKIYENYDNASLNRIVYIVKTNGLDTDPSKDTNKPTLQTVRPSIALTYIQNLNGIDTGLKIDRNPQNTHINNIGNKPMVVKSSAIKFDKENIHFNYITKFNLNKNIDTKHNKNIIINPRFNFKLYYPEGATIDFYDHKNVRMKSICVLTDNENEINRVENQIKTQGIDSVDDKYKLNKFRNFKFTRAKNLIPQEGDNENEYSHNTYINSGIRYVDYIDYRSYDYVIWPIPKYFFNNDGDYRSSKYGNRIGCNNYSDYDMPIDVSHITNILFVANMYIPITNNNFSDKYYTYTRFPTYTKDPFALCNTEPYIYISI